MKLISLSLFFLFVENSLAKLSLYCPESEIIFEIVRTFCKRSLEKKKKIAGILTIIRELGNCRFMCSTRGRNKPNKVKTNYSMIIY